MSETDDDYQDSGYPVVASLGGDDKDVPQNKKRKIQRACDVCRRKKVSNHLGYRFYHPVPRREKPSPAPAAGLGGHTSTAALGDPDLPFEDRCRCMGPSGCLVDDPATPVTILGQQRSRGCAL